MEQINKIDFKDLPLTIGGGEPTYHPNFYFIINNLREDIKIDLLTNLQFDIKKFIKNISIHKFNKTINPAYKSIRVSFHPAFMKAKSLINKVKILQDEGYSIGVLGISHPMNLEANVHMAEESRKAGVYFFIKDFLGTYKKHKFGFYQYPEAMDGKPKEAFCRTHEILVNPEGNIFKCHYDLYKNEFPVGILGEDKLYFMFRHCSVMGLCNPCDIKNKANRFLQMGNCSVEIIQATV